MQKELIAIQRGAKGERDCAFLLDNQVKDYPSRVLIHDLRIENNGEIVQFDHLLINRRLEFWILESKYYSTGIKINDLGEFEDMATRILDLVCMDTIPVRESHLLTPTLVIRESCARNPASTAAK